MNDPAPRAEPPSHTDPSPANIEAEQGLLGAILLNNTSYLRVAEFLRPEHFATAVHGRIYAAIGQLLDQGLVADPVTLKNLFDQDGALAEIGGAQYLARLAEAAVTVINSEHYGRTIHDLHLRRELILLAAEMSEQATKFADDEGGLEKTEAQIARAEATLAGLRATVSRKKTDFSMAGAVQQSLAGTERAYKRGGGLAGLSTGLIDLDAALGGLVAGELIVLAGRPGAGKTAMALGVAEAIARSGVPCGICEIEQSADQLAQRLLARHSDVSAARQRRGDLDPFHWLALTREAQNISKLPILIDDTPAMSLGDIRRRAQDWRRSAGIKCLIVDHLQLMHSDRHDRGRSQEIDELTSGLKTLAKELDLPVLALSQLSRAVELRDNKRPMLADLRESGSIEQNADVVIFLYREEYYLAQSEPTRRDNEPDEKFNDRYALWQRRCEEAHGLADAIVAKNRQGPTATVKLHWSAERMEFSNLARGSPAPS